MSVLVDTNILLRRLEPRHAHYRDAVAALGRLIESGEAVHVTAQNVAEFWAAATRTPAQNGLGLSLTAAAAAVDRIEQTFVLLPDEPTIYEHWKRLITMHQVSGNRAYDARLVAVMLVYGIGRILTFNVSDFAGYGVSVLHPSVVS
ncbi:MAG TPA: type II toxin-antitoxin system VapC family toxin [Stellaceae bacterium]|nr:type II toxin-antitoxin system VapC family toxin [Stellaceae bacterium]